MFCPSCGVATQPGSRFCSTCGASLVGEPGAAAPEAITEQPHDVPTIVTAATATPPAPAPLPPPTGTDYDISALDDYLDTSKFMVIEQTTPTAEQIAVTANVDTGRIPITTDRLAVTSDEPAPSLTLPLVGLAAITAVLAVAATTLEMVSYRVSGDRTASVIVKANDLSTNSLVASVLASVALVAGAVLALRGQRVGAGLAGGAALALAGLMGWLFGESVAILDTVRMGLRAEGVAYRLSTTYGAGVWLAAAASGLAFAVFVVSLASSRRPGHRVHPAVGTLGALGTLAAVVGPLIPLNGATLADNFSTDSAVGAGLFWKGFVQFGLQIVHSEVPPITTYLRLVMLLLVAVGGLAGFLVGSRWSLGLALGSFTVSAWMCLTSQFDLGDRPYGPAGGNPGTTDAYVHPVTAAGSLAVLVAIGIAVTMEVRARRVVDQPSG